MASISQLTSTLGRRFIGTFIAIVLGLQIVVVTFRLGGGRFYPFVGYAMYSRVHVENEPIAVNYPVFVQLPSGEELRVAAEDLGMNFWKLHRFTEMVLSGSKDEAQMLMSLYESRSGRPVAALRIASYPAIISRDGVKAVPSETLLVVLRASGEDA
jgi:hypothetical protein